MKASNRTETRTEDQDACRCTITEHRRAALVALCRAAMEVDDLRDVLASARREPSAPAFDDAAEIIEQIESRLYDEGRALGVFDDEYECDCGRAHDEERDPEPAPFVPKHDGGCSCVDEGGEDGEDGDADRGLPTFLRGVRIQPIAGVHIRPMRRSRRLAPIVFGVLGVACALASFVTGQEREIGYAHD